MGKVSTAQSNFTCDNFDFFACFFKVLQGACACVQTGCPAARRPGPPYGLAAPPPWLDRGGPGRRSSSGSSSPESGDNLVPEMFRPNPAWCSCQTRPRIRVHGCPGACPVENFIQNSCPRILGRFLAVVSVPQGGPIRVPKSGAMVNQTPDTEPRPKFWGRAKPTEERRPGPPLCGSAARRSRAAGPIAGTESRAPRP